MPLNRHVLALGSIYILKNKTVHGCHFSQVLEQLKQCYGHHMWITSSWLDIKSEINSLFSWNLVAYDTKENS